MKAPSEGITGELILMETRNIMENVFKNNEASLKARGVSRAKQWEWMREHGITYTERSFVDWNPANKKKRLGSVNLMVIVALATHCNQPLEIFMHGKIKV